MNYSKFDAVVMDMTIWLKLLNKPISLNRLVSYITVPHTQRNDLKRKFQVILNAAVEYGLVLENGGKYRYIDVADQAVDSEDEPDMSELIESISRINLLDEPANDVRFMEE